MKRQSLFAAEAVEQIVASHAQLELPLPDGLRQDRNPIFLMVRTEQVATAY